MTVLNEVVNVCGKVMGERSEFLSQLYEYCMVQKVLVISNERSPVLAKSKTEQSRVFR